jgi:hypothetical protein
VDCGITKDEDPAIQSISMPSAAPNKGMTFSSSREPDPTIGVQIGYGNHGPFIGDHGSIHARAGVPDQAFRSTFRPGEICLHKQINDP